MPRNDFVRQTERAGRQYWRKIDRIAAAVRAHLVIPFCNRHNLRFTAGMGTWSFDRGTDTHADHIGPDELQRMRDTKRLYRALTADVENRSIDLGCLILDYTPPTFRRISNAPQ